MIRSLHQEISAFVQAQLDQRRADVLHRFKRTVLWPDCTAEAAPDLVLAPLTLAQPDLSAKLAAIHHILAEGGLFLGAVWGGRTLEDLRTAFIDAECAATGGAAMRFAPLPQADELSRQMLEAGFALPVVDVETVQLSYASIHDLLGDIRFFRTQRADLSRPLPRKAWTQLQDLRIREITGEILFLHGWKKEASISA